MNRRGPRNAGVRRPEGALGIVRMGGGHAEQGVDRVADVLLDRAALGDDERRQLAERPIEGSLHALGPELECERRGAHDVDEKRGDDPPLQPLLAHASRPTRPRASSVRSADASTARTGETSRGKPP
jgi:hypothetical protein